MPPTASSLNCFDTSRCPKFNPNNDFTSCTYYDETDDPRECGFCKLFGLYRCIAHNGTIPLSYSSVSNFLTCHHLYYLSAIRGIQTRDAAKSSPLKCGTLWDKVLQKYLGRKDVDIPATINQYEIEARDVAKVRGLYRAYKDLEIQIEPNYELQAKIDLTIPFDKAWGDGYPVEIKVKGFYDRKYATSFVENKLSGRPDSYLDPWFIESQIATYFLADPSLEHVIMEIARTPALKSTGKSKDESPEELEERTYQDAISRPSHYFIGYDIKTHKYGKKFYRNEFNLEEVKSRYLHIFREMYEARLFDGWWKNSRSCAAVFPGISCDMLGICRYNTMSESVYQIREKPVIF